MTLRSEMERVWREPGVRHPWHTNRWVWSTEGRITAIPGKKWPVARVPGVKWPLPKLKRPSRRKR